MVEVQGSGAVPPEWRAQYKQDFSRSVDLFQRSLEEYEKADEVHKKAKFKEVMDKALQVMNETAKGALSTEAEKQKEQLEKDYQHFIAQNTPENYQKVTEDVADLKKLSQ
jgi:hypothetical protein